MTSLSLNNKEENNNNKIFSDNSDSDIGVSHEDGLTTSDLNDLFLGGSIDNPGEDITSTYTW